MELDNDEQAPKRIKLEVGDRPLNFAINPDEFDIQCVKKPKAPRDPMSHRIIEKRRRDRMNNCLADLSRLIPSNYLKQGQGRIEKTEIIEMASKHIRHLQNLNNFHGGNMQKFQVDGNGKACCEDKFYMGFKECEDEALRYLIEIEGRDVKDQLCSNLLHHLDQISKRFLPDENGNKSEMKRGDIVTEDSSGFHDNQTLPICSMGQSSDSQLPCQVMIGTQTEGGVNMEMESTRKQNNFLRTLLLPKDQVSDGTGSGSVTSNGNESCISMLSIGNAGSSGYGNARNEGEHSLTSGSQYMDKLSNNTDSDQSRSCSSNSSSNREHVYKFKHNITKRFSQEEKKEHHQFPPSDSSSSSSREDEKEKVKRKFVRHKSRPPSSESTAYPSESEYSFSPCESQKHRKGHSYGNRNNESNSLNIPLPAFVLNPDGTHYMPVSIHPSHLENIFSKKEPSPIPTYHPISIPVNFMGPYVSMRGVDSELTSSDNGVESIGNQSSPYAVVAK